MSPHAILRPRPDIVDRNGEILATDFRADSFRPHLWNVGHFGKPSG
ncbi:hypothetical protein [Bradyrhizobium tunisiense]